MEISAVAACSRIGGSPFQVCRSGHVVDLRVSLGDGCDGAGSARVLALRRSRNWESADSTAKRTEMRRVTQIIGNAKYANASALANLINARISGGSTGGSEQRWPGIDADGSNIRSAPMISRQWRGLAKPDCSQAYADHLRRETLPAIRKLPG